MLYFWIQGLWKERTMFSLKLKMYKIEHFKFTIWYQIHDWCIYICTILLMDSEICRDDIQVYKTTSGSFFFLSNLNF